MTYEAWKAECDRVCNALCGLDCDDLPDYHWADDYEDMEIPVNAVNNAIQEAGGF